MTLEDPVALQNLTYDASEIRLIATAALRPGIVDVNDLKVSPRALGANMSVDIAPGTCCIGGTDQTNQGRYVTRSTGVENRSLNAAPGAGQSRIDVVYARVRDGQASGGADNDWVLGVQTGAAATTGSQVAPALPSSSLELARVTVASGTASITAFLISDRRAEALRRTTIDSGLSPGGATITPSSGALTQEISVTTRMHAYPVEVSAVFVCDILANTGQSNCQVTARIDISLDSGATYAEASTPNSNTSTNNLLPSNLATTCFRGGTASGSVVVRAMLSQKGGAGVVKNARLVVTTAPRNS